jgi:hypothetical protein
MKTLKIFYQEPDPDRWMKYDRYPRRIIRRILRGRDPVGGVQMWFLNLIKGLDILGYPYQINDFKALHNDPDAIALVIGKPHLIDKIPDNIRIIYGPALASHPADDDFWDRKNIIHILISCKWFAALYKRDLPIYIPISIWPSGVDTNVWKPNPRKALNNTWLIYDKIRWEHDFYQERLINPIIKELEENNIEIRYLKYGSYLEDEYKTLLQQVDGMVFLCEHETQGFAYLQALASNVPILAWDRGGFWRDPAYYPHKVKYGTVSAVPYWSEDCGLKFKDIAEFQFKLPLFIKKYKTKAFNPRKYILDNLTLEKCAETYVNIVSKIISHQTEPIHKNL